MNQNLFFFIIFFYLFFYPHNSLASTAVSFSQSRVIEQYKKALEINPDDSSVRYYLGVSLIQHGDLEGGIRELKTVYKERKDDPEMNFNLGYAYLQSGNNDMALKHFNIVNEKGMEYGAKFMLDAAFLNLGMRYQDVGDYINAAKCFNTSLAIKPANIKTYLLLSLLSLKEGKNRKAVDYIEAARKIDNKDEELILMASSLYNRIGIEYLGKKQYLKSREEFNKSLAVDSSNTYAIYYLSYIDYLQKDVDSSSKRLEVLTALNIEDVNIKEGIKPLLFNIGVFYMQKGDFKAALNVMENLTKLFPKYAKARYYAGLSAMDLKKYDKAILEFEKFLEFEPDNADATVQIGIAYDKSREMHFESGKKYYKEKRLVEAFKELERTLEISPDYGPARQYMDIVNEELKAFRKEEAIRLEAVLTALIKEVGLLLGEGELLAARSKLLEAKSLSPSNAKVEGLLRKCQNSISTEIAGHLAKGNSMMENSRYYEAVRNFRKVIYFEPQNKRALSGIKEAEENLSLMTSGLLAEAKQFMAQEMFKKAFDIYAKVLTINPSDGKAIVGRESAEGKIDIYFNEYLGMARDYVKLEQLPIALDMYGKALRLKPDDAEVLAEIAVVRQGMGSLKGINEMLSNAENALKNRKYNAAISGFTNVLKLDSDNGTAKNGIKKARIMRSDKIKSLLSEASKSFKGKRYKETISICRDVLKLKRGEAQATELINLSKKAISSTANPYLAKGKTLFDKGNVDGSVIYFKKALKADPGNSLAQRYLSKVDKGKVNKIVEKEVKKIYLSGIEHYTKGRYDDALASWSNVLELDPGHEKALLNIDKARRKLAAVKGG